MTWLHKTWPKASGLFSLFIIIYLLLISPFKLLSIQSAGWLNLAFLMLHQIEEYVYPGGFKDFFNKYLYNEKGLMRFRLNDKSAFHVNVTLGWTVYLICAIVGSDSVIFLMIMLAITFINGVAHTGAAIVFRRYNPGLITGTFIFVPFTLYIAVKMAQDGLISSANWITIAVFAVAGTLSIPVTLFIFKEKIT